ncbi:hypothetical protein O0L34_g17637 [Tuta absoluta]|nr:hypothetical protein O0L34_g17637 [Tuta absoluta]
MSDNHDNNSLPRRGPCPYCPGLQKLFVLPHGLNRHIGRMHKERATEEQTTVALHPSGSSSNSCQVHTPGAASLADLPSLKRCTRVLKHVPKGARYLAAGKLSHIVEKCIQSNTTDDWFALLSFSFTALKVPDHDKQRSLTAKVKENIEAGQLEVGEVSGSRGTPSIHRAVEKKVFEGDLRGAARLLVSECSLAPASPETLSALQAKHPSPSRALDLPLAPDDSKPHLTVKPEQVISALNTFVNGSAPGLDGLRPEHLKELTSLSAGDNGLKLLESLTRLCNFLLRGSLNAEVCPYLYGGSLCALSKKDGGVRPIAVGSTIRRLVAKLGCRAVREDMATHLQPHQVGFGTVLGCEAAIHATRAFASNEDEGNVLIKIDLCNAFNSVERDSLLKEAKEHIPVLFPFLHQVYAAPSNLYYDGTAISSEVGAQQGDPLGPLLFSLAIQNVITTLDSPLNVWYLDDGTIGGSPDVVARDLQRLFPALKTMGLEVNSAKCEFYACRPDSTDAGDVFRELMPGLRIMAKADLYLLGAPIFAEAVSADLQTKTSALSSLAKHLEHLSAHVSLILLRSCFSMPKITYTIRTAPTWLFPREVASFDETLKHALEGILNIQLDDTQWTQASLPIRHGGLGVRRMRESSPSAFLASSFGVTELVARILPSNGSELCIPYASEALVAWSALCPSSDRPEDPTRQRQWDDILCKRLLYGLIGEAVGANEARLRAASQPESGAWLQALPSPHIGTLLDNDSLRVAAALRLGCAVCEPHVCVCGSLVDSTGHHGLACVRSAGRISRHHALNEIIRRAIVSTGVPCVLEPPGLCRTDGKRPDGLTLIPWQKGRCLLWDATCVSTFAISHIRGTQKSASSAAETAAGLKHTKYANFESAYDFLPFAVETSGTWGSEAKAFVREVSQRLRRSGGDPRAGSFLAQHIALAIQRGNAASILGTFGRDALQGGLFD